MLMAGRKYTASSSKYRYGFNGKDNDNDVKGEGNQQDYGMRIYDPRLVRFLSVDPITNQYPELTPYQFASNRTVQAKDLDGCEAYFNNSGEFVKWGEDKTNQAPVILVLNEKEIKIGLTITEFKNRVYWLSGEGASTLTLPYYAHAIKNAKSYGYHGEGFSEEKLYQVLWRDNKYDSKDFLAGLPDEQHTNGYQSYKDAYSKKDDLNLWDSKMKERASGILFAESGIGADPTRGATNWGGGKANFSFYQKKFGSSNIISITDRQGFVHNFFNLNTEKLKPEVYKQNEGLSPKWHPPMSAPKEIKTPRFQWGWPNTNGTNKYKTDSQSSESSRKQAQLVSGYN
jgi:RHS repeat-associated protein